MNYPEDSREFSTLMDVTWQSLGRNFVEKQTKQYWFGKLQKYPLGAVAQSFDEYLMAGKKEVPSVAEIIKGCIPKEDFYKAVGYVRDEEINKAGLKQIDKFVADNIESKTDYKAWAKRIVANPQNFPAQSLAYANEALGIAA